MRQIAVEEVQNQNQHMSSLDSDFENKSYDESMLQIERGQAVLGSQYDKVQVSRD